MEHRTAYRLVVGTTLLLVLAGCGGAHPSPAPPASSARATPTATAADLGSRVEAALATQGSYTFTLTRTSSGRTTTSHGEVSLSGADPDVELTTTGGAGRTIRTGGAIYVAVGGGKPWLRIPATGPAQPQGSTQLVQAALRQQASSDDPQLLVAALDRPVSVGAASATTVDGVAATHYVVVVGRTSYAGALGYPQELATALPRQVVIDVWLDHEDLPRRISTSLVVGNATVATRFDLAGFGSPVSVAAPPASQVTTRVPSR